MRSESERYVFIMRNLLSWRSALCEEPTRERCEEYKMNNTRPNICVSIRRELLVHLVGAALRAYSPLHLDPLEQSAISDACIYNM